MGKKSLILDLRPRLLTRIWNKLQKCYDCGHPFFMHTIGGNWMECHSWRCECYQGDEYD